MNRDLLLHAVKQFTDAIPAMGVEGYVLFFLAYALADMLIIPVIPLAMAAGAMFGVWQGSLLCCSAATFAAVASFIIARYFCRGWVATYTMGNPKFRAIDNMLSEDSFKVILLLRVSPIMPLSLANYLYGLTSVRLPEYMVATWIGFFPGTVGLVASGALGQAMSHGAGPSWWQILLGVGGFIFTMSYLGYKAQEAMAKIQDTEDDAPAGEDDSSAGDASAEPLSEDAGGSVSGGV